MFQSPRAPYTTSNNFTNFTPNFYTRPYILSHVVPTFFASDPPERGRLPGAALDPPPASSARPGAGLPANAPAGSEYKVPTEDALRVLAPSTHVASMLFVTIGHS